MKLKAAFFSATHTTQTIVTRMAQGISSDVLNYNLTKDPFKEEIHLSPDEVLLVGMPVYAGRIPAIAAESLKRFKGQHTPAILIAVYGNRDFDDALVEMQDILERNGFFILAAGTFIAQHSIFPHTAKGRPDASDFVRIDDFANRCRKRLEEGISGEEKSIELPGHRPYKVPGNIPLKVKTSQACTECGACIKVCPVNAIPINNPHQTDYSKCIHCGRCIHACSAHARHYGGLLYLLAGAAFSWKNRHRKEPQLFF